ncbi:DNA sulfur modification protein DndB [Heyndrickxia vini]|uniref:ParB/Sulfiredoxin domain-containing protein n=1 Tax=Heyndrickxia vini TaxID=1476025 RepID=A0ABX7DXN2_9BACI|nr:DNA sulfur modification protein DndB [Heyndrickxia vini]QQZ07685.1 hypothetical protein I5776_11310 [Heyndrickxia vini]
MIINEIFTKRQTIISYSLKEIKCMFAEDRLVFKEVRQSQVRSIKKYIFENAHKQQVYFPPIVASVDKAQLGKKKPQKLTIIDGSKRIKALLQLDDMIAKAIKSDNDEEAKKAFMLMYSLKETEFAFQIFEGLTKLESDQLYIDLNTKGKKVSLSKRIEFDSRNEINQITNYILQHHALLKTAGVETEKQAIIRPGNKKLLSLSQLRQLVSIFLTGNIASSSLELNVNLSHELAEYSELIIGWFDQLFEFYPAHSIGDYHESMLASFPVLISVALYSNKGLYHLPIEKRKIKLQERMRNIRNVNWKRTNKDWEQFKGSKKGREKYFYLAKDKKNIKEIVKWLENQRG